MHRSSHQQRLNPHQRPHLAKPSVESAHRRTSIDTYGKVKCVASSQAKSVLVRQPCRRRAEMLPGQHHKTVGTQPANAANASARWLIPNAEMIDSPTACWLGLTQPPLPTSALRKMQCQSATIRMGMAGSSPAMTELAARAVRREQRPLVLTSIWAVLSLIERAAENSVTNQSLIAPSSDA
jgi:hypothetical protein